MSEKPSSDDVAKTIARVQKLIALAQDGADDEEPGEESRTAALQAIRIMREANLTVVPSSELERMQKTVGEARDMVKQAKDESRKNMIMGGLIGYALSQGKLL